MTIEAIETQYAGCRFRSRLEARWAHFFDHLRLRWEYEPQGYRVGRDDRLYLPDFYLPGLGVWVEVKGEAATLDLDLIRDAVNPTAGLPRPSPQYETTVLILGPIPKPDAAYLHWAVSRSGYCENFCVCQEVHFSQVMFWPTDLPGDLKSKALELGMGAELHQCGRSVLKPHFDDLVQARPDSRQRPHPAALDAYRAARSARFEHGETPKPPVEAAPRPRVDSPALDKYVRNAEWYRRSQGDDDDGGDAA